MSPCWSHHRGTLITEIEMRFALVLLHIPCIERPISSLWCIFELRLSSSLKIRWVCSKFIMSSYLIQSILIPHVLIFRKINWIPFFSKSLQLFGAEILAPWSRVVPMWSFELIFCCFIQNVLFWALILNKSICIIRLIPSLHSSNSKIGLSHFHLFTFNIEIISFLLILGELYAWCWNLIVWS